MLLLLILNRSCLFLMYTHIMGCGNGLLWRRPQNLVFTDCGQFLEWMRKYMSVIKDFDAQTYIKTYKCFNSSVFTSETRFPFMDIERRFVLFTHSQSNICLNFCALLVGQKFTVACLKLQLWKKKDLLYWTRVGMTENLHLCGTKFYITYVLTVLPTSLEH